MKFKEVICLLLILSFLIFPAMQTNYKVYADSTSTRVRLTANKSVELTNLNEVSKTVHINYSTNSKIDYTIYDSSGAAYTSTYDSSFTAISIPASGKVIMTARNDFTTVTWNLGDFTLKKNTNSTYKRIPLEKDKSIKITNLSDKNKVVHIKYSINGKIDYAIYDSSGETYASVYNSSARAICVPSWGEIIITSINNPATVICENKSLSLSNITNIDYKRINLEE
ncbi:MAG: hypothetical protein AB6733_23725 [Clostridiaceae bacterium]